MTISKVVRLPAVMEATGLKRSTIYARMAARTFPASIKMGRSTGWLASDVEDFIRSCVSSSRQPISAA